MAKKPAKRTARQRAEDANRNPFVGLLNKAVNIGGVPVALALAGWIYHGIQDTKDQVALLQNTVIQQHVGTAGDIQRIDDGMRALWQAIGKLMERK